jgi:acyl carrier protein
VTPPGRMDIDELAAWLTERIGLDATADPLTARTPLTSLDSLQAAELWVAAEDLGLDLPEELFGSLTTMGDFFYYYETKTSAAR